ncbi:MAG: DNA polymerase III subunit chi [Zoogloeaceae bacterium]|jgi:DNA polymerase-3 subunit chi|nr:DNA polymerase III subunit chi [Zoogloeaceae bacterium]
MTQVIFYHNAPERAEASHALLMESFAQGKSMTVFVPDPERAEYLDRLLWTSPPTGFLPHCSIDSPLAAETPILFAGEVKSLLNPSRAPRLFNLAEEAPDEVIQAFAEFRSLIEVIGLDPGERERARERVRRYKVAGFSVKYIDLAGERKN